MKIKKIQKLSLFATMFAVPLFAKAASLFPELSDLGLSNKPIEEIIANFAKWILSVFGFLAIITFIIGGIMYLIAAGDEGMQERAKKTVVYGIIGVVVGLSGLIIITAIQALLGGSSDI